MAKVDHALAVLYDEQELYLVLGGGAAFTPSNPLPSSLSHPSR